MAATTAGPSGSGSLDNSGVAAARDQLRVQTAFPATSSSSSSSAAAAVGMTGPRFDVEAPKENVIYSEIVNVTSAMRKNSRWASTAFEYSNYNLALMQTNGSSSFPSTSTAAAGGANKYSTTASVSTNGASGSGRPYPKGQRSNMSLMNNFLALKIAVTEMQDVSQIDALTLLHPFLEVVRSPETSGPITATALSSIDKFITYSILTPDSPSLPQAMAQVSAAGTHCKFEASDSASDEVVLLRILDVLKNCLTGPLATVLSDESVCEMMETGLSMCCQMRLSEILRKSAERSMQTMVAAVFSRLRTLPDDAASLLPQMPGSSVSFDDSHSSTSDIIKRGAHQQYSGNNLQMLQSPSVRVNTPDPRAPGFHGTASPAAPSLADDLASSSTSERRDDGASEADYAPDVHMDPEVLIPYGLPAIQELLRVLIALLNPHDQQHTDSMRLMALGLLNVAVEIGGSSIGRFPVLRAMAADHLCKHLLQLARSDNSALLSASLRVVVNVFSSMRQHLKLQQELFLSFLLDRLVLSPSAATSGLRKAEYEASLDEQTWLANGPRRSASRASKDSGRGAGERERADSAVASQNAKAFPSLSAETRELMLEVLSCFTRGKWAFIDLWVNYDCQVEGEDLAERLIKFCSRGVFPSSRAVYALENSQVACLDTLLELVANMAARSEDPTTPTLAPAPFTPTDQALTAEAVAASKSSKRVLLEGAAKFNMKPKIGLAYLEDHGVIYSDPNEPRAESLAKFFKTTPRLDKRLLGDFISRPDQLDVLKAFMNLMDFEGKIICDAMRELLEAFRLPGESQQINRITETFAEVYFATNPPEIKSQDATYVLAYSVIMLNTDLHNPQVRKRMDITAYSRNLRGVNDGQDFSPDYLKAIYDSIRKREIVLPEEHHNQVGFEYGWKELLRRSRRSSAYVQCRTKDLDKGLLEAIWMPCLSAMSYAFANFADDFLIQRVIGGFNHCAALAAAFDMPDAFDYLIESLARVTGLVHPSGPSSDVGSFPVVDVEGQKVTVSPLSVRFGANVKAQLAAVVLFTVSNGNGAFIRDGWQPIFEILLTLFTHSLLPPSLLQMEDFLSGVSVIPLKPLVSSVPREDRRNDGGLLSTLSSYLLSPYNSNATNEVATNDFSDEDIETTLSAVDCIATCRIEELYAQIMDLDGPALTAAVETLIELSRRSTLDKLRPRSSSTAAPGAVSNSRVNLPYDPSAVLVLEILSSLVARAQDSLVDLWPSTFDYLSKLLSGAASYSSLFNERVVAALLRLLQVVVTRDELRDSTFLALDLLRNLPSPVLSSVSEPLMTGLARFISEHAEKINSTTEWTLVLSLVSTTMQSEEASKVSFDVLSQLAAGKFSVGLTGTNYAPFLHVLASVSNAPSPSQNGTTTVAGVNGRAAAGSDRDRQNVQQQPAEIGVGRGQQILDLLRETQAAIPRLISESPLSGSKAWEAYWIPLLSAYASLCLNSSRELRQTAITSLQRTLLAPEILQNDDVDLTVIFEKVFFPMLEELLKPQVFRRDPEGMAETRLRSSALLCKIYLQYLTQLSERQGMDTMIKLWLKILGYQDRFMHSGRRDSMYEAVPESLKNVLLVMNASGFLVPPHAPNRTSDQAKLWDATFDRITPFLPTLKNELFPTQVPVPFAEQQQQQQQPASEQQPAHARQTSNASSRRSVDGQGERRQSQDQQRQVFDSRRVI